MNTSGVAFHWSYKNHLTNNYAIQNKFWINSRRSDTSTLALDLIRINEVTLQITNATYL